MTPTNTSLKKAPNEAGQNQTDSRIPAVGKARGRGAWHRRLFGRRIWEIGITLLYMIVYYLVGTVMIITRSNYRAQMWQYTAEATLSQRLYEVSKWIGLRQNFWLIPAVLGILLGTCGFSYLFNMVKMDFYESQPMPREQRFRRTYMNGVLIFTIPYVISQALAVLIAAVMGGMTGLLMVEILAASAQTLIVFLSSYSIAVFAATLSGNGGIAVVLSSIILCIEYVYYIALNALTMTFFQTFYYDGGGVAGYRRTIARCNWFKISPLLRIDDIHREILGIDRNEYVPFTQETLHKALQVVVPENLWMLAIGAAFLAAAYVLFKIRRAEAAGETVIYPVARWLCKTVVVIGGALFAGIEILYPVCAEISGDRYVVSNLTLAGMLFVVVLLGGIIQGIYDMNAKRFFAKLWQTGLCGLAAAGIFAIYRYDLTGYDTYLPEVSDVAYAALVTYDNSGYSFDDPDNPGTSMDGYSYSASHMQITDVTSVEQLAQIGMATQVSNNLNMDTDAYVEGWTAGVIYTMRDGRKVARQITIPYDIDSDLMDRIVGSQAYKEGFFPVYQEHNTVIEKAQDHASLTYTNGLDQREGDASLYAAFCEAYKKDLENYSYSYAVSHYPVGAVILTSNENGYEDRLAMLEVYPDYANTIRFLKENGLYVEDLASSGTVTQAEVDYYGDVGYGTIYYTDPDKIQKILDSSLMIGISRAWDVGNDRQGYYTISLQSDQPQADATYNTRAFKLGQVPQFVIEDIGASVEDDSQEASLPRTTQQTITINADAQR